MHFSPHIWHSLDLRGRLLATLTLVCVLNCGCASLPRFAGQQLGLPTVQAIPTPKFDEFAERTQIASSEPAMTLAARPAAFAWRRLSTSAGGRPLEGVTVGQGGYRTIVLGSLAGDDPLAVKLTEQLAQHIHQNQIVLGGVQATVLRNLNPDGAVSYRMENDNGIYLNRQFDASNVRSRASQQQPEVRFLLGLFEDAQPQRVIHIRSVKGSTGIVAASAGSASVANDVCGWLNFKAVSLPGNAAEGTIERFLSQQNTREIVTFAIPQTSDKATLWEDYGDSLLNLLLAEDFETRKLARQNQDSASAGRRARKSKNGR